MLEHDFTLSDLQEAGVIPDPITHKVKPMGMSVVLSHKYTDGVRGNWALWRAPCTRALPRRLDLIRRL